MLLGSPDVQGTPAVILVPGEEAFAAFAGGDSPGGSVTVCPPSFATLRVTPPGATGFATVSAWNTGLGAYLPDCAGLGVTMGCRGRWCPTCPSRRSSGRPRQSGLSCPIR